MIGGNVDLFEVECSLYYECREMTTSRTLFHTVYGMSNHKVYEEAEEI
jgi:hypothetical protein